jgi:hypothetical protein
MNFRNIYLLDILGYLPYLLSPEALVGVLRIKVAGETYFPTIFDN